MSSKSPLGDPVTLPMKLRRFQIEIFLGYFDIPASLCICTALSRKEVDQRDIEIGASEDGFVADLRLDVVNVYQVASGNGIRLLSSVLKVNCRRQAHQREWNSALGQVDTLRPFGCRIF